MCRRPEYGAEIMIIHSFDETEPVITPEAFFGKQRHICDICIVTFSGVIYRHVLEKFSCEKIASLGMTNKRTPVYLFEYEGRRICFYLSDIGASIASANLIEANWLTGASKFIMFGSAGSLNTPVTYGKYVIPEEAYRSEGTSYHYAPPADYIRISGSEKMEEVFTELGLPFVKGRVWTTDCAYRETAEQVRRRQEEGCLAVEMELAGIQAVCDFHGLELYDFLVTGDVLDDESYSSGNLDGANHDLDKFYIALETALRLDSLPE